MISGARCTARVPAWDPCPSQAHPMAHAAVSSVGSSVRQCVRRVISAAFIGACFVQRARCFCWDGGQALRNPLCLAADDVDQRVASLAGLVSAPHVQHLLTKNDVDELAKHGFLVAEPLHACTLACQHAAAVNQAFRTMKDISVIYCPAEVGVSPDMVRALLNHFAQLDEAAQNIPWSTPQDGQLAVQAFKQHFNMTEIAAPKLDGYLRDLRTAVDRFLPSVGGRAVDAAALDGFFTACHNARKFALWHEDPAALRASLDRVEAIAKCSAAAAVWQEMAHAVDAAAPLALEWPWRLQPDATAALYSATNNPSATGLQLTKYTSSERAEVRGGFQMPRLFCAVFAVCRCPRLRAAVGFCVRAALFATRLQPSSFAHPRWRRDSPPISLEVVIAVLQKWRADFEARLRQHTTTGIAKLGAGAAKLAGHLKAFSESSSQEEAQMVNDSEIALLEVRAKVVAVTGKHGPALAALGTEGHVADALQEADQTVHKAKMMQVGWGLAELCRRPKVADPLKGKKIRSGLHQLYKDALEPATAIEFISADTLVQAVRFIKMDHPKVGMLKNVREAAVRDAVMAAINDPLAGVAAPSAGGCGSEADKPKRGKKRPRGKGVAGEEEEADGLDEARDED